MKLYITSHRCKSNEVKSERYWIADSRTNKLIHLGVCDIDQSFLNNMMESLVVLVIRLDIPDDAFKQLMIAEGYSQ